MKKTIIFSSFFIVCFACHQKEAKKTVPLGMDESKENFVTDIPVEATSDSHRLALPDSSASKHITMADDDSVLADGTKPTPWMVLGIKDSKPLKHFISSLQKLVLLDRRIEISTLIRYPLKKNINNTKDFLQHYDSLFTPAVKESLAKTNLRQLYRNGRGVKIGNDKIWIAQQGKEFKIIAINN